MIEYVNPEGQSSIENTPYQLSASIKGANAIKIGFLANGFPDSENFLALLAEELSALEPGIETEFYNKGNASIAVAPSSIRCFFNPIKRGGSERPIIIRSSFPLDDIAAFNRSRASLSGSSRIPLNCPQCFEVSLSSTLVAATPVERHS